MANTPAQKRANAKWMKNNLKQFKFGFNINTDQDIISWLESRENKIQYIKALIRSDMAQSKRFRHMATVEANDGFFVDIEMDTKKETYNLWLFHEDIGVKELMYGLPMANITIQEVIASAPGFADQHMTDYQFQYMDID